MKALEQQKQRFGETERSYQLHLPTAAPPSEGFPVLFVFHGSGSHSDAMVNLGFRELADKEPTLVVFPNGTQGAWNDERPKRRTSTGEADDLGFVTGLIDSLGREFAIDTKRLYAAGFSNGGMFCHRLAARCSERFAAVAAVAGTLPTVIAESFTPQALISVMTILGTQDDVVGWPHSDRVQSGEVLTGDETVSRWIEWNGCTREATTVQSFITDPQTGTRFRQSLFSKGRNGSEVVYGQIDGGGHDWPKSCRWKPYDTAAPTQSAVTLAEIIWNFLRRHRRGY